MTGPEGPVLVSGRKSAWDTSGTSCRILGIYRSLCSSKLFRSISGSIAVLFWPEKIQVLQSQGRKPGSLFFAMPRYPDRLDRPAAQSRNW